MEVWRPEVIEGRRPEVLSRENLLIALGIHVGAFVAFWLFAVMHGLFEPKETIIPIDLTVIVNDNLDGVENEPPPLKNPPPPEPPKPKPKPKPTPKKVEPPKALEQMVTNIVKKVEKKKEKKKEPPQKDPPKKKEPKKPEPPKKTAAELRKERLKRMRESAVKNKKPVTIEVKNVRESGNGRTAKQTMSKAEIQNLLNQGYRPGTENQLATSELQLGVSRIQMALNEKWNQLGPKVGKNGVVMISCKLNSAGGLMGVRISSSCGDNLSDQAALSVAREISSIRGLPDRFLAQFMKETLTIRYQVRGR